MQGAQGEPGAQGVVSVKQFSGAIGTVGSSLSWVFAGPTATITVDGTDTVTAVGTAAVRGTSASTIDTAICSQPGAFALTPLGDHTFGVELTTVKRAFPATGVAILAAGTYQVGFCVRPGVQLLNNDHVVGWVQVANSAGPV